MQKCSWCKKLYEPTTHLNLYCEFCKKNQNHFLNTASKLDRMPSNIDTYIEYVFQQEDLKYEEFYPEDLMDNGIIHGHSLATIPVQKEFNHHEYFTPDLPEENEYQPSEEELKIIERIDNLHYN